MIVSLNTYLIIIGIFCLLIVIKPLYTRFIKKEESKNDAVLLLLLLTIPINWFTPTILTITDCSNYTKEVVLFPTTKDGFKISYGRATYILNKSDRNLTFEYYYYGDNTPAKGEENKEIGPKQNAKVNVISIDYILSEPAESVSTKSSGATKTVLRCK